MKSKKRIEWDPDMIEQALFTLKWTPGIFLTLIVTGNSHYIRVYIKSLQREAYNVVWGNKIVQTVGQDRIKSVS